MVLKASKPIDINLEKRVPGAISSESSKSDANPEEIIRRPVF
jgi:hypothetical protein